MKKLSKILLVIVLMLPMFLTNIHAEEPEERAVIYCDRYKSKHRMYYYGSGNIYDEGGDNLRATGFRFYKCACGEVIFSNNRPEDNNNIPGKYIDTSVSKEGLYDGYIVYSSSKIGTNLPINEKYTPMVSCNFY